MEQICFYFYGVFFHFTHVTTVTVCWVLSSAKHSWPATQYCAWMHPLWSTEVSVFLKRCCPYYLRIGWTRWYMKSCDRLPLHSWHSTSQVYIPLYVIGDQIKLNWQKQNMKSLDMFVRPYTDTSAYTGIIVMWCWGRIWLRNLASYCRLSDRYKSRCLFVGYI